MSNKTKMMYCYYCGGDKKLFGRNEMTGKLYEYECTECDGTGELAYIAHIITCPKCNHDIDIEQEVI